jgi:type III secretion protein T
VDVLHSTESYASLLFALPGLSPTTVLAVFFLTMARLFPIFALAPFLGAPKNLPGKIRVMFSIALVAIFLPQNLLTVHHEINFNHLFTLYVVKEMMIGFILGFLASIPFFTVQMAGSIIDHQRGSSSLMVTDPATRTQTSAMGALYNYLLIVIFFSLNGPFLFFEGVATSYQLIPVDQLISATFFTAQVSFWKQIYALFQTTMTLAIQISAPGLIGIFLTDMFLGIANRLAPQVQIVFLGISLKSWVGIALVTAAWSVTFQVIGQQSISWMHMINKWIQTIGQHV